MNTLHHFKKRYAPLYLCVLVGCECCLYGCEVLNSHFPTIQSEITATLISLGTTFILCLFFTSSLKAKLYVVLLFQILASLGEAIFTFLFTKLNPDFYAENDTAFLYSVIYLIIDYCITEILNGRISRNTLPAHVIIVSEADTCALSGIQVFDFIYTNHIHHHLCMPAASTSVSD